MRIRLGNKLLYYLLYQETQMNLARNPKAYPIPKVELDPTLDFGKYQEDVERFTKKFSGNFTESQVNGMICNLNSLKILEENYLRIPKTNEISLAVYDNGSNRIILKFYEDLDVSHRLQDTLSHELLHMASTRGTNCGVVTGMEIPRVIGVNLNEGYTNYLATKYFSTTEKYRNTTDPKTIIAKGIENIVGAKQMEKHYFEGDLKGLIEDLESVAPRREIIRLLFAIDHFNTPLPSHIKYVDILEEIAKLNKKKLDRMLVEGSISEQQYQEELVTKVILYRKQKLISEEAMIVGDNDHFIIIDGNFQSKLYDAKPRKQDLPKEYKK